MDERGPLWTKQPPDGPAPGLVYANAVQRSAATFVDYLAAVLIGGIPYAMLGAGGRDADRTIAAIGNIYIVIVFFAIFGATAVWWNGQTVGGRLVGLRIVRRSDGGPIGWGAALVRPIGVLITVAFWFISLLAVVVGKEKRTPADALTGTVVIKPVPVQTPGTGGSLGRSAWPSIAGESRRRASEARRPTRRHRRPRA